MIQVMEHKLRDLRNNIPIDTQLKWQCDTRELKIYISLLGDIVQEPVGVSKYSTFQMSTVTSGKKGSDHGELITPQGVAVHEVTNQIYVANFNNNRVDIFSNTGEYLNQLGVGYLDNPYGITINRDIVYIGEFGSKNGQFKFTAQLTTDQVGHVYIADGSNNTELDHLRNITHQSMSMPADVKKCYWTACA
ncbi:hypothetical protein LOD99_7621 [Oopsacas minuta]|uniref:Uncharacterized protein n=1 Tax=Oopsacas minuta TaxID=111878 RepID=A0AAV7JP10_9METZ|nr:hypothetical protein LOD99_7621 [Oopsacas minuta]